MVTLVDIREAESRIRGKIIRTPLVYSPTFSSMSGAEVYLKLESMQKAGSFKVRGATNRILSSRDAIGPAGVIAASAGNHAQGVAVAAGLAGVPAAIVMPEWTSLSKQEASRGYGARVILAGTSLEESIVRAKELAGTEGMMFIHPYDDPAVVAGQGTIGLEILADLPDVDRVLVPVGGGGLIAGIALAVRGLRRSARVTGVQASACPSAIASRERGGPVAVDAESTIADGIRVKRTGDLTFPLIRDLVDQVVAVEEQAILDAVLLLLERKKVLAEGAGAVPLAALLSGAVAVTPGEKVVLVISGGNVDTFLLERILKRGLFDSGRIARIAVLIKEDSRSLPALLEVVSREGGVIGAVDQDRDDPGVPLDRMRVRIEVETRGPDHRDRILSALQRAGYRPL
ncbi:threonine dehydratase [Methanolinea mesophila]|uniref:threonine ammonia-lyase n=1 Tax=Methanolinea mesophila TaxID=547055 RepID=UPI001AE823E2|nr:threonine ammonia-lyase [Methanolinea mesophila]MBP1928383.1 threonine dehydratase [Methanolinea mesophila]